MVISNLIGIMKLNKGDVFKINTKNGLGFLQYIETDRLGVEFIRVLEPISNSDTISQNQVDMQERWNTGFPLKAALKKNIVEKIGNFEIPKSFIYSEYARSEHSIRGEFIGWHIVNKTTLKRQLKKVLSPNEINLSPYGVMNDTLIIERLEQNWRLQNWK